MSEKKGGSARRALQKGSRQVQPAAATRASEATTRAARREGTKRITVDLPTDEHRQLKLLTVNNDVDGIRVVRALLLELHEDEQLMRRVLQRAENLS